MPLLALGYTGLVLCIVCRFDTMYAAYIRDALGIRLLTYLLTYLLIYLPIPILYYTKLPILCLYYGTTGTRVTARQSVGY
jgi:hypothetical protein